jgi:hypothetical protein
VPVRRVAAVRYDGGTKWATSLALLPQLASPPVESQR